jgi:hypothetical protein
MFYLKERDNRSSEMSYSDGCFYEMRKAGGGGGCQRRFCVTVEVGTVSFLIHSVISTKIFCDLFMFVYCSTVV